MKNFNLEEDMRPLFNLAESEGKWLYCSYQGLWFSPEELKAEQAKGQFRWGSVNWQVRDPLECLAELQRERMRAERAIIEFVERMGIWRQSV
jgi:hypothetical protein